MRKLLTLVTRSAFSAQSARCYTVAAMMVLALWYLGRRLRFRGEYLRLLERERTVEAEREVAAERTRIAREMHDIVSHSLASVIYST